MLKTDQTVNNDWAKTILRRGSFNIFTIDIIRRFVLLSLGVERKLKWTLTTSFVCLLGTWNRLGSVTFVRLDSNCCCLQVRFLLRFILLESIGDEKVPSSLLARFGCHGIYRNYCFVAFY